MSSCTEYSYLPGAHALTPFRFVQGLSVRKPPRWNDDEASRMHRERTQLPVPAGKQASSHSKITSCNSSFPC